MQVFFRMAAPDEGMQGLQPVHQALGEQKLQGAIDGRRRRPWQFVANLFENLVGTERPVASAYDLQYAPALGRESQAAALAQALGVLQHAPVGATGGVQGCTPTRSGKARRARQRNTAREASAETT